MRIGIRADANEVVATGHVMRCLTIAEELKRAGAEVIFFSADEGPEGWTREIISSKGIEFVCLNADYREMGNELPVFLEELQKYEITQLLVDSYYVSFRYFTTLQNMGIRVLYMDDRKAFPYSVNGIVNYSPAAPFMGYEEEYKGTLTGLGLGEAFVPLRSQFREQAEKNRQNAGAESQNTGTEETGRGNIAAAVSSENKKTSSPAIFITSGGSDPLGINSAIVNAIEADGESNPSSAFQNCTIHLLAGSSFKPDEVIQKYIKEGKVLLHQNVSNVAEIMSLCDVGVTPAGMTLYELASLGVPSVSYLFADNQAIDAQWFDEEGLMHYAGDFREDKDKAVQNILTELKRLLSLSNEERKELQNQLSGRIDGLGASRIAAAVLEL